MNELTPVQLELLQLITCGWPLVPIVASISPAATSATVASLSTCKCSPCWPQFPPLERRRLLLLMLFASMVEPPHLQSRPNLSVRKALTRRAMSFVSLTTARQCDCHE